MRGAFFSYVHVFPVVVLLLAGGFQDSAAQTVRPEDCPASVPGCPCDAFDSPEAPGPDGLFDDTACWQWAINRATNRQNSPALFGTVEATSGSVDLNGDGIADSKARYIITKTLKVTRTFGGAIDGNGAVLEWYGNYFGTGDSYDNANTLDCSSVCGPGQTQDNPTCLACHPPMFLLRDTNQLKITNLTVGVPPTASIHLHTAFEFTNNIDCVECTDCNTPPYTPCSNSTATSNVLEHVTVGAGSVDQLDYGVRFSTRYGRNENNDQSTIMNSGFGGVTRAAISIEHDQSHQHRLYAVSAGQAAGTPSIPTHPEDGVTGASFVRLRHGGFTSIGGFRENFSNAEYFLYGQATPTTIIDSNSEGCRRFIETNAGSCADMPVHVYGGRFSTSIYLAADGRIINWFRGGPLTVRGLDIDGIGWPGASPHFYLSTPPPAACGGFTIDGPIEIANNFFFLANSSQWDTVVLAGIPSPTARLEAHGNLCQGPGLAKCRGAAAGMESFSGVQQSELASLSLLDGHATYCSDCTAHATPCQGGGTGTVATRLNGQWDCGGGVVLSSDASVTYDSEWDTAAEINARTTDDDFASLSGTQTVTNKTLTSTNLTASSNVFPGLGMLSFTGTWSSGTRYLGPGGVIDTSEGNVQSLMPAITVKKLVCRSSVALGGSSTRTIHLRRGGINVLGPCTLNSAQQSCTVTGTVSYNGSSELLSLGVNTGGTSVSTRVSCTTTVGF